MFGETEPLGNAGTPQPGPVDPERDRSVNWDEVFQELNKLAGADIATEPEYMHPEAWDGMS